MVRLELLLIAFALLLDCARAFEFTNLSCYRDFDVNCVAEYLQEKHNLSVVFKAKQQHRLHYCKSYMQKLDESFYETVESRIRTQKACVINLLKRHNLSDVFFKAIIYNYFKRQLVKFASNKTCDGVVNVLRVDNDSEMSAEFIGDRKSLWKLRPCLDDLFGEFNVKEIVFVDRRGSGESSRIGFRRFGRHLLEFISQIVKASTSFCNELNIDFMIKYFGAESLAAKVYNQTEIECFISKFINHWDLRSSAYRFYDTTNLIDASERCDAIMKEQVNRVVQIDLFGFAELSQRVKDCLVKQNSERKMIEQVIVLPAIGKRFELSLQKLEAPRDIYVKKAKEVFEITLDCLRYF